MLSTKRDAQLIRRKNHHVGWQSPWQVSMRDPNEHVSNFYDVVKHLVALRRADEISNDVFEELVKQIAASFVEVEVSDYIERALDSDRFRDLLLSTITMRPIS